MNRVTSMSDKLMSKQLEVGSLVPCWLMDVPEVAKAIKASLPEGCGLQRLLGSEDFEVVDLRRKR